LEGQQIFVVVGNEHANHKDAKNLPFIRFSLDESGTETSYVEKQDAIEHSANSLGDVPTGAFGF
jgi:hypothetical protein